LEVAAVPPIAALLIALGGRLVVDWTGDGYPNWRRRLSQHLVVMPGPAASRPLVYGARTAGACDQIPLACVTTLALPTTPI
jgi:hypothetical protein